MRFALLGDHPDGLAMAHALVTSGRHELLAYSGPSAGAAFLRRWEITARSIGDVEEILADPAIDAVIVAGKPADRPAQLRRALQSERHVLCVHPADDRPDIAYEAAMIQQDTRMVLMPVLAEALHPALGVLSDLMSVWQPSDMLIELEQSSTEAVLLDTESEGHHPGVPGWPVLRLLGGEIAEIVGLAATEDMAPDGPLLLAGRFVAGGMFRMTLLPGQVDSHWRLIARTKSARIELDCSEGWPSAKRLVSRDETGQSKELSWNQWDPWAALVETFEQAVATKSFPQPNWREEVRCLELDDAARRSVERRRASTLDYQEATEEVGFKGTMTLVGCALLWGSLVLLLASVWVPILAAAILPVFGLFLLFQFLRWFLPAKPEPPRANSNETAKSDTAAAEPQNRVP
ncbi:MAG TPA: Gfo/Idh/MocA family oxidoreductase [Gemmataceae bacterium]|nr:Gfo/Idh/MocA family oxidoreductase [Gemmataceae bacterium]